MKKRSKQPLLNLLFAVILLGIAACAAPTLRSEGTDSIVQQTAPATLPATAGEPADNCLEGETHPIGESMTRTYDVSYEQVMTWFCSGYSFDNILIALETSEAVDVPADGLLQMLQEKEWEQIWVEVGLIDGQ